MTGEIEDVRIPSETGEYPEGTGPIRFPASSWDILRFVSGDSKCFEQRMGQIADCILKDIKYDGDCGNGGTVIVGAYARGNVESWGKCAEQCTGGGTDGTLLGQGVSCLGWTWGPQPCEHCTPHRCFLFSSFSSCPHNRPKEILAPGFISGGPTCKDIEYFDNGRDGQGGSVKWVRGAERGSWSQGKCLKEGGEEPACPGQDVPGFRSQHER